MLVPVCMYGIRPVSVRCPYCKHNVVTVLREKATGMAWLICFLMCCVGLWPCSCIAFCINDFQEVQHQCPNCRNILGVYRRA